MASSRVFPLDLVRADGWFEGLRRGSPSFERVTEVVGELPLAFSIILGVQITAIDLDNRQKDASIVEFVLGDDTTTHRVSLGEFRRRVAVSLVGGPLDAEPLPDEPDAADLERFIGGHVLLLAPLFGISMRELVLSEGEPPRVRVDAGEGIEEARLSELRRVIDERVLAQVTADAPESSPFSIDLSLLPRAEEAAEKGDAERVVAMLGAWPGPLSVLLRTAEGQRLGPDVKSALAHALGLLGTAYSKLDRRDIAEEAMRLGIQWARDDAGAGDLFRRLGESCLATDRPGEAIGFLRRALALGVPGRAALPLLARAFAERGKMVAALACVDEALALGVAEAELAEARAMAEARLGESWEAFRTASPAPSPRSRTLPPRGPGAAG